MKVVAKPISMVAWFEPNGALHPVRFKITEEEDMVIKVDRILSKETEKFAGNPRIVFNCQSIINGCERLYQIKYEVNTCKWILFKIWGGIKNGTRGEA